MKFITGIEETNVSQGIRLPALVPTLAPIPQGLFLPPNM